MAVIQTFSTAVLVSTCLLLSVTAVRYPMTTTVDKQISTLRNLGYDIYKLDHSTQLRVFLYTWLSMERGEMGLCTPELKNGMAVGRRDIMSSIDKRATWRMFCPGRGAGEMITGADRWCCDDWMPVMGICTRKGWYFGAEAQSLRKTFKMLQETMWSCGDSVEPYPPLPE